MYCILVGIIQGCPSSGMLFATASHPFFLLMERQAEAINDRVLYGARVLCCADDVGGALASYKLLLVFKPIFELAEALGGLTLKAAKCVLIPLCYNNFDLVADAIREWLGIAIPGWSNFKVEVSSRYLGFWLGPDDADSSWRAPAAKYVARSAAVAACGLSASWSILAYNTYVLPVLLYVAQFSWVPAKVLALELPCR